MISAIWNSEGVEWKPMSNGWAADVHHLGAIATRPELPSDAISDAEWEAVEVTKQGTGVSTISTVR